MKLSRFLFSLLTRTFRSLGFSLNAGSILTLALIGSIFGLHLVWVFIPIAITLIAAQQVRIRLGAVAHKGPVGLARENFSLPATGLLLLGLILTDIINLIAQFAGIAASLEMFGFNVYVSVPAAVLLIHWLSHQKRYLLARKVFLTVGILYCLFVAVGVTTASWKEILPALHPHDIFLENDYLLMLLALVGSVLSPRLILYTQSTVTKKRGIGGIKHTWFNSQNSGLLTIALAFFTVIAYAETLFAHNIDIVNSSTASLVLQPAAGTWAAALFAVILLNASLFSASSFPLHAAYSVCDAIGCKAGFDKSRQEAPLFYRSYTTVLLLGALPLLIPDLPFLPLMLWSQVANGILLPFLLFSLLRLSAKQDSGAAVNNAVLWISCSLCGILLASIALTSLIAGN